MVCTSPCDLTTVYIFCHVYFLPLLASLNSRLNGFLGTYYRALQLSNSFAWNALSLKLYMVDFLSYFKSKLKSQLFRNIFSEIPHKCLTGYAIQPVNFCHIMLFFFPYNTQLLKLFSFFFLHQNIHCLQAQVFFVLFSAIVIALETQ